MAQDSGLPQLLRLRLKAQADLFAALTSHPTLIGTGREDALAELFRQFMPRRFEVLEGTVAILDANQRPTRSTQQLDMIVADTMDYPTLMRSGNVAVVLAQSVRAVMEVKSNLKRGPKFVMALVQIARARQVLAPTDPVFTALFSFGAPTKPETLRDWLEDVAALRQLLVTKQGDSAIVKLRDEILRSDDEEANVVDEADLLAVLANENLPDMIAADQGAVARKRGDSIYTFLEGSDEVPSVMVLVDQLVEQLATMSSVSNVSVASNVSAVGTASAISNVDRAFRVVRAHLAIDLVSVADLDDLQLPPSPLPDGVAS